MLTPWFTPNRLLPDVLTRQPGSKSPVPHIKYKRSPLTTIISLLILHMLAAVTSDGFNAQDMTFENTAGPRKHHAVAFQSGSDISVFYRCSFKDYQETLYVHSQR